MFNTNTLLTLLHPNKHWHNGSTVTLWEHNILQYKSHLWRPLLWWVYRLHKVIMEGMWKASKCPLNFEESARCLESRGKQYPYWPIPNSHIPKHIHMQPSACMRMWLYMIKIRAVLISPCHIWYIYIFIYSGHPHLPLLRVYRVVFLFDYKETGNIYRYISNSQCLMCLYPLRFSEAEVNTAWCNSISYTRLLD